jgi:outer membrane protein assembly factor BamB
MNQLATVLLIGLFARNHGPASPPGPQAITPRFWIDSKAGRVLCDNAAGKVAWSRQLDGPLDQWENAALAWDDWRVYVAHNRGVTALAADTGKPLWHAKGPCRKLVVSGRLLLAAGQHEGRWWLTGRGAASGCQVFRTALVGERFDPQRVGEIAGLFLFEGFNDPRPPLTWSAVLIDREGQVRHRFRHRVVAALRLGEERIILTGGGVMRLSLENEARWAMSLGDYGSRVEGSLVVVGGDLVAFLYGPKDDTGVDLVRLNAASGRVVWRARCPELHGRFIDYEQRVTADLEGSELRVTSRGSYGTFVEVLDLRTGRRITRSVSIR